MQENSSFTRIVKMSFQPDKTDLFLEIFKTSKEKIRGFKGCLSLELLRDKSCKNVFFTVSKWENEYALEDYRTSDLFRSTWKKTKVLFNDKPLAFSCDRIFFLPAEK
ncbi:putative quinol monooxygenase [Flexithrix dorotheae]|uniref:putative quinol monooxygenase n=1 Tax=Flexithrix dorotheae TaxID=70993 RepID=UPI00037DE5C9|nr:antibiotic biosynthesis monooxygenase family protein [Flexithrix dorotheae]